MFSFYFNPDLKNLTTNHFSENIAKNKKQISKNANNNVQSIFLSEMVCEILVNFHCTSSSHVCALDVTSE